ncbi:MAG: response regulator [Anaerolineae bacterium]|nr:response regulator [Anaerolineae bacterium]
MATILIVDDRPTARDFLVTLLGYQGHRLLEAAGGAEGLELARAEQPNLIITDVLMPMMDGYEFCRQLRAEPALASTPIIFYTAYFDEPEAQALAQTCGVRHILPKPSKPEVILQIVETVLGSALPPVSPPPPEAFDREHLRLLTNKLSEKVDELQEINIRLSALIDINLQLAAEQDPRQLLERFCHAARELMGARVATVSVLREGEHSLRHFFASGLAVKPPVRLDSFLPGSDILAPLLAERRAYRLQNPGGAPRTAGFPPAYPPMHSLLAAPILSPDRVYGWLCLIDKIGVEEFTQEDERLAAVLAAQVGRVYQNGRLYEEARRRAEELERAVAERQQTEEQIRQNAAAEALARVAARLNSHLDLAAILNYESLTSRQREVLQLIVEGHTNAEIAARLVISPRTVEFHRAKLMRKLGARTQADLVRYALRQDLLPPE